MKTDCGVVIAMATVISLNKAFSWTAHRLLQEHVLLMATAQALLLHGVNPLKLSNGSKYSLYDKFVFQTTRFNDL